MGNAWPSRSSRTTTTVSPAGPRFFWAPANASPTRDQSTGREATCEEKSTTSGALQPSAARSGKLLELDAVDGLVAADVHVGRVFVDVPAGRVRYPGMAVGRIARDGSGLAVLAGLLQRLLAPAAGDDEVRHRQCRIDVRRAARFIGTMAFSPRPPPCMNRMWNCGRHGQQFAQRRPRLLRRSR